MPAPPFRCHGDQRFWRAGRIMFELSREHVNMSFSCAATHWHSRSLLVLHKIDLSKARASLTWQEIERLPPYLSCSALLKQFVHRSNVKGVNFSTEKNGICCLYHAGFPGLFSWYLRGFFVVKNWTGIIYFKNVLKLLKWSILGWIEVQYKKNMSHHMPMTQHWACDRINITVHIC